MAKPKTLFDKIWTNHLINKQKDGTCLIYVDRHLIHEVTSPQAFEGLLASKRGVRRSRATLAVADHNVPTTDRKKGVSDQESKLQIETLAKNCKNFKINFFSMQDIRQGIVHIVGPEQGFTLPGMTIVCGDSHTSTHGAFGALAFGIGTSEVEHVLATQTLIQSPAKNMRVTINGGIAGGVFSKDLILAIIGKIGTAGGTGYVIEYAGKTIEKLSMEARMSICNMSIEAGARAGMVAPDEKTFAYLKGREFAPKGVEFSDAVERWTTLKTDKDAVFDKTIDINADLLEPMVTWGTNPGMVTNVTGKVPDPNGLKTSQEQSATKSALEYMGLSPNEPIQNIAVDRVFIGSCTNSRIEDLREAAKIAKGQKVNKNVYAMVVPGSTQIKQQAEKEGLDEIFTAAGFDWRQSGCSMCLGMNPDILNPKERCASTSNRNFEGRQGKEGRTHLVSPAMAAAAAVKGHFVDIRDWE